MNVWNSFICMFLTEFLKEFMKDDKWCANIVYVDDRWWRVEYLGIEKICFDECVWILFNNDLWLGFVFEICLKTK